jgi:hypothetical protein
MTTLGGLSNPFLELETRKIKIRGARESPSFRHPHQGIVVALGARMSSTPILKTI